MDSSLDYGESVGRHVSSSYLYHGILWSMAALFLPSVVSAAPVAVSGMDAGQISANIDQGREWKPKENDADIKVDHAKEKTVASNVKIKLN